MQEQVREALEDLIEYMDRNSPEVPLILNYLSRCCNLPTKKLVILDLAELWEKLENRDALKEFITVYVIRYSSDPIPKYLRRELENAKIRLLMSMFLEFCANYSEFNQTQ